MAVPGYLKPSVSGHDLSRETLHRDAARKRYYCTKERRPYSPGREVDFNSLMSSLRLPRTMKWSTRTAKHTNWSTIQSV